MLEADLKEFRLWLRVNPRPMQKELIQGQNIETLAASYLIEYWNIAKIQLRTENGLFVLRR
jgi:hypothetical protein